MKKFFILTLSLFFSLLLVAEVVGVEAVDITAEQDAENIAVAGIETTRMDELPLEGEAEMSLLQKVEAWYSENMNYTTIAVLMTVESSFIPFPSEIVVPPAAYIASQPGSHLNIYLVVFFATIGALIGAFINYFGAIYLGRPIVYRFVNSKLGHMLLLSEEKLMKAELYFNRRGRVSTFIGRLIPGIRQLISIPAGLARMNMASFAFYTFIGAGIWNIILALLGYLAHGQQELINRYTHELSILFLGLVVLLIGYIVIKQVLKKRKAVE